MKKIFALILAAAMLLSVVGCSVAEKEEPAAETEVTSETNDEVIATVGDKEITLGEYKQQFDTYAEYYTMFGYDISSDTETLNSFQDFVVDLIVEENVIAYQAEQMGYGELSEEDKAEAQKNADADLTSMLENYRSQAESEAAADSTVDVEARIDELMAQEAEYYTGSAKTRDEFAKWILEFYSEQAISEKFQEAMLADITVSDDEVNAWYNDALVSDADAFAADAGAYKDRKENEELLGDTPVTVAPEGYSRILHILVTPEGEMPAEYDENSSKMDSLRSEYGELAFDAEVLGGEGESRMEEITEEYEELERAQKKLSDEYFATAKTKADEAYAKLEDGADFATVMAEYTSDIDMQDETAAAKGLLISNKYVSESDWSNEIKAEFATLKQGEYSDIISDTEGYHIIYYLADEPAGNIDLATMMEAAREMLKAQKETTEWETLVEEWKNDDSVTLNEELIRSLTYAG